jgi:Type II secretion system (T2SS), protein E, N-terminal domain
VKTLGEIAIEAGLVTKASAAKAGRMAEERKEPLVVVLVRELGVDEVALVAALRRQTRVPLIDPGTVEIDPEALRQVPRDVCARLRVLPLSLTTDGRGKLMRIAMADPTDTSAIVEIEQLTHCDVEIHALPLSAIDELIDKGYRQVNTAVVSRAGNPGATMFVTSRGKILLETESEVSVTAQIPLAVLQGQGQGIAADDLEERFTALVNLLVSKGVLTEGELAEALRKGKG